MNNYGKEFILNSLIKQIKKTSKKKFSIYGIGEITNLLLIRLFLESVDVNINFFIDSNAQDNTYFHNKKVITPLEAVKNGEKDIIVVSWNNKELLKNGDSKFFTPIYEKSEITIDNYEDRRLMGRNIRGLNCKRYFANLESVDFLESGDIFLSTPTTSPNPFKSIFPIHLKKATISSASCSVIS